MARSVLGVALIGLGLLWAVAGSMHHARGDWWRKKQLAHCEADYAELLLRTERALVAGSSLVATSLGLMELTETELERPVVKGQYVGGRHEQAFALSEDPVLDLVQTDSSGEVTAVWDNGQWWHWDGAEFTTGGAPAMGN